MGEFKVEVIRVGPVEKHPNADRLSITRVHGGYPVIFQSGAFKEGDLAVYVPVDAIVPNTEEWAWLNGGQPLRDKDRRIRAKRLRKVFSMGLLTEPPPGAVEGQDVAELMGITRYDDEPAGPTSPGGKLPTKPLTWWQVILYAVLAFFFPSRKRLGGVRIDSGFRPRKLKFLPGVYDIEPFRRYGRDTFLDGEVVVVTEKIHGQNASYVHDGKKLCMKSRTQWRSPDPENNTWAQVARKYDLENKLAKYPGILVFGETYGNNSDMAYGVKPNEVHNFAAFDCYDTRTGRWLNYIEFRKLCNELDIPMAPVLAQIEWGPDSYDYLLPFAEGNTTLPGNHVREGFVVKSVNERVPRAILKLAGEGYHTRKEAA
jgi:hypothetical protein